MPGICCTWTRERLLVPESTDTAEENMHFLEPEKLIKRLHNGLHMEIKMLQYAQFQSLINVCIPAGQTECKLGNPLLL